MLSFAKDDDNRYRAKVIMSMIDERWGKKGIIGTRDAILEFLEIAQVFIEDFPDLVDHTRPYVVIVERNVSQGDGSVTVERYNVSEITGRPVMAATADLAADQAIAMLSEILSDESHLTVRECYADV